MTARGSLSDGLYSRECYPNSDMRAIEKRAYLVVNSTIPLPGGEGLGVGARRLNWSANLSALLPAAIHP